MKLFFKSSSGQSLIVLVGVAFLEVENWINKIAIGDDQKRLLGKQVNLEIVICQFKFRNSLIPLIRVSNVTVNRYAVNLQFKLKSSNAKD